MAARGGESQTYELTTVKLLILGATGGSGQQLVSQALEAGHEVTAFVRTPEKISVRHGRLRLITGNVNDGDSALADAVSGQNAVISALGRGTSFKSDHLIQRSTPAIVSAMQRCQVRRFIFTSAIGVGDASRDAPVFSRIFARLALKDIYADKAIGEEIISQSDLDWTIVQPAQLTNGPVTGKYRAGEHLKLRGIPRIARADLAQFVLNQLDDTTYVRKIVRLGY